MKILQFLLTKTKPATNKALDVFMHLDMYANRILFRYNFTSVYWFCMVSGNVAAHESVNWTFYVVGNGSGTFMKFLLIYIYIYIGHKC